jgi:hypothetical protein
MLCAGVPALERGSAATALTQRISNRACAYDFHCEKCDFDQYFEDILSAKTKSDPTWVEPQLKVLTYPAITISTMVIPGPESKAAAFMRIGLDDFSQKVFGQADGFELPLMGKETQPR